MALDFDGLPVELAGASYVEVVPAPSAGVKRVVATLRVYNRDSAAHTFVWKKVVGGTDFELGQAKTVAAGGSFLLIVANTKVVCDEDTSIEVKSDAPASADEPVADPAWMDYSP